MFGNFEWLSPLWDANPQKFQCTKISRCDDDDDDDDDDDVDMDGQRGKILVIKKKIR